MPRPSEHEIEESYDREGLVFDEEDEALIRHVLLNDAPRQGLHRHGDKDPLDVKEDNYLC
jgi:hypothetical protein